MTDPSKIEAPPGVMTGGMLVPQESETEESLRDEKSVTSRNPLLIGTCLGMLSATCYSAANIGLRDLSVPGDFIWAIWVTCVKAFPAALTAWVLICWRFSRGLVAFPPKELLGKLLLASLLMQFGGNLMFQSSLSLSGLALTVPMTFATLLATGAWLGRIWLGETITPRTLLAISVLILAIAFLSMGANHAARPAADHSRTWTMFGAILTAALSGIAYGTCGVVIRGSVSRNIPLSATLVCFSTMGVVVLGTFSLIATPPAELWTRTAPVLPTMLMAGSFNAIAFFSIGAALQRITVVHANLLNASQIAMCSLAGVLFFHEHLSFWLVLGTVLTIGGLVMMDGRKASGMEKAKSEVPVLVKAAVVKTET